MAFVLRRQPTLSPKYAAFTYQLDALHAVKDLQYAAIFHEQGLGKTKIAIDLSLLWLKQDAVDTVLIVTKKSLVENWRNEVATHCHITPHILSGNRAQNSASLNSPVLLYITNYEVIAANAPIIRLFLQTCRAGCVLDESQKIKNPKARLTRIFHDLGPFFERRVIMTGTPVANRPYDIWAQIRFLDGGEALGETFDGFKRHTDLPATHSAHDDYGTRLSTIHQRIDHFTVRETKDTAGIHLPEKTITPHYVDLPPWQLAKYTAYRDALGYQYATAGNVAFDDVDNILKRLLRLVQCASNPALVDGSFEHDPGKFPLLLEMCRELTPQSKLIIWTGFIGNVEWLAAKLAEFDPVCIHGGLPMDHRNQSVHSFTKSTNLILIATPGAAKEGLTLSVANHAIFFDRGFSLDDYLQAQDRIHRISQTRHCYIHNLIARQTIDEWVDLLLTAKYRAAQVAQGDIDTVAFAQSFRTDLATVLQGVLFPDRSTSDHQSPEPIEVTTR